MTEEDKEYPPDLSEGLNLRLFGFGFLSYPSEGEKKFTFLAHHLGRRFFLAWLGLAACRQPDYRHPEYYEMSLIIGR